MRSQVIIANKIAFSSLKIVYVLTNSVDPDEMPHCVAFHTDSDVIPHYVAFHLGLHCLPNVLIYKSLVGKGLNTYFSISYLTNYALTLFTQKRISTWLPRTYFHK